MAKKGSLLDTIDFQKVFLLDCTFLTPTLVRIWSPEKILLRDQELLGTTTMHILVGRSTSEDDPFSAFLFTWALEI